MPLFLHAEASGTVAPTGGSLMSFLPITAIFGIFYFLLIRPQQKQAKELQLMLNNLKRGDKIMTQGGLLGTVQALKGKAVEVKINEDTKVLVARSHIAQLMTEDLTVETPTPVPDGAKNLEVH